MFVILLSVILNSVPAPVKEIVVPLSVIIESVIVSASLHLTIFPAVPEPSMVLVASSITFPFVSTAKNFVAVPVCVPLP